MRFSEHHPVEKLSHVFSVHVDESELSDLNSGRRFTYFSQLVLNKLAALVAAYYFRRHKDDFVRMVSSEDLLNKVADIVAARIKLTTGGR